MIAAQASWCKVGPVWQACNKPGIAAAAADQAGGDDGADGVAAAGKDIQGSMPGLEQSQGDAECNVYQRV